MKYKLSSASDNSVEECQALACQIQDLIRQYRHVSQYVPLYLTQAIDRFKESADKENDFREDQF